MKLLKFLLIMLLSMILACNSDDDICTGGEGTPRMKIKFKDANNRLVRLNKILVDADYGSGSKTIINAAAADSILVPLKIDGSGFTDLVIRTSETGSKATVRVGYTEESQYVSPACGIRKLYHNVASQLQTANPVTAVEQNQTEIIDEKKTALYLIF